jgi:hypothetical protein
MWGNDTTAPLGHGISGEVIGVRRATGRRKRLSCLAFRAVLRRSDRLSQRRRRKLIATDDGHASLLSSVESRFR